MSNQHDDDLDALLDEAMDIVDSQERDHEEEVKRKEAKLDEDIQRTLDEAAGGGEMSGDMMKMFQSLLGAGISGDGDLDDASFEGFKQNVGQLLSTLENMDDLKDGDRTSLTRVKEMMAAMENDDEEKAMQLMEEMRGSEPAGLSPDDQNLAEALGRCDEALKQLSTASATDAPPTDVKLPTEPVSAEESEKVAKMVLDTLLNPEILKPLRLIRDAFDPWLAANEARLSADEKDLYKRQHNKTKEICVFLDVPIEEGQDDRVAQLMELLHEFSELGEPPQDLANYAPAAQDTA